MKNEIKVSVIIPVYNAEEYIDECLLSLINQTFKEKEIICVDDGSTDNTPEILEKYQSEYNYLKVITQANKYAGTARNTGIDEAKGEYLLFLDSDDFFDEKMIELAYEKAIEENADIVIFNADKYNENMEDFIEDERFLNVNLIPKKNVFSVEDVEFPFQLTNPAPWNKLFRKEFVENEGIRFSTARNAEDMYFTFIALATAQRITCLNNKLVHYRISNDSSVQRSLDISKIFTTVVLNEIYDELEKRELYGDCVKQSFINGAVEHLTYALGLAKTKSEKLYFYKRYIVDFLEKIDFLSQEETYYITDYGIRMRFKNLKSFIAGCEWVLDLQRKRDNQDVEIVREISLQKNPSISIVVSIYNAEKHLIECLNSLTNQTLENIEIICVNDGSTDNSLTLLNDYAKDDKRIMIVSQENAGCSKARNTGVKFATGKYLYFMNSNDLLEENALEVIYQNLEKNNLDILYFDAISLFENEVLVEQNKGSEYYQRRWEYNQVYTGFELLKMMSNNGEYRSLVELQIINKQFFVKENLWFYEGISHSSNGFTMNALLKAKHVSHLKKNFLKRRIHKDLISTQKTNFSDVYGMFICYIRMIDNLKAIDVDEDQMRAVCNEISKILQIARKDYLELDYIERNICNMLDENEKLLFISNIHSFVNGELRYNYLQKEKNLLDGNRKKAEEKIEKLKEKNERMKEKNEKLKEKNERMKNKIDGIQKSKSYKFARFLTSPVRVVKRKVK